MARGKEAPSISREIAGREEKKGKKKLVMLFM